MSHGDYNEHGTRLKNVRAAADITGKTVGVFADLQGPKIRLGRFLNDEKPYLAVGDIFTITIDDIQGTKERCSTTFKGLPGDVNVGDQILIDDGKVALKAIQVTDTDVGLRDGRPRSGLQQQGHQPARRRRLGPRPVRQGQA